MVYREAFILWEFQPHFRTSADSFAKGLFAELELGLEPSVFFVFFRESRSEGPDVAVAAEWPELFTRTFERLGEVSFARWVADEGHGTFQTGPEERARHERSLRLKAISEGIAQCLREDGGHDSLVHVRHASRTFQVGRPTAKNGYLVYPVLSLQRSTVEAHPQLQKGLLDGRYIVPRSLFEAVGEAFLEVVSMQLKFPNPVVLEGADRHELLRRAVKALMYVPAWAGAHRDGIHGLERALNLLSAQRYESATVSDGRLILARRGHPHVQVRMEFVSDVRLRDLRAARKVLQLSSGQLMLLSDGHDIFGLGSPSPDYDPAAEDLFEIHMPQQHVWELHHGGQRLLRVEHDLPVLPQPRLQTSRFESMVRRIFGEVGPEALERLWSATQRAVEQRRGAMLVISELAEQESTRLASQSTPIKPREFATDLLELAMQIDGALLLDPSGRCHAIGVILDGPASPKGTPSRGSRYNSAIRYIEAETQKGHKCLAIVVSEDGYVNIMPDLMPQISRALLTENVARMKVLATLAQPDARLFHRLMDWFESVEFYLSAELCADINRVRLEIESKLDAYMDEVGAPRILYRDFSPHPELNDSYFKD